MNAKWLMCLGLVTACGFGDNGSLTGNTRHQCGLLDPTEGCDDGNVTSGDGCSETCAAARIHTLGHGADVPVADNATDAGRRQNRRIEFRILAPGGSR